MPLVRVEVRNEYGLGMPELYTETNREDPKAVLDGVAVAGLVGILRQLGDLAEVTKQPPQNIFPPCFVDATTNRINSLLYKVRSIIHLRALKSLYDQWLRNSHLSLYSTLSLMSGVYMHSLPSLKKRADAIGKCTMMTNFLTPMTRDVAAGALIVKEAGGLIFDPSGNDFDITAQRIAASNPLMVMNWTRKVGYTRKLPHNHIQATSTTILSCGP